MKKNHSCYRRRYLKHIALVLLFYPLSALGAQGHISIKGQSITIMQAIQLIEKTATTRSSTMQQISKTNNGKTLIVMVLLTRFWMKFSKTAVLAIS